MFELREAFFSLTYSIMRVLNVRIIRNTSSEIIIELGQNHNYLRWNK